MKVYLLFCLYFIVITSQVDSNNLEYQNSQYVASNLHADLSNIAREGNSNSLYHYNLGERNSNLFTPRNYNLEQNNLLREGNSNNLNLVNAENYLFPNDLLREGNSNYLISKNNNLLRYNLLNVGREKKSNNLCRTNFEKSNIMPDNLEIFSKQEIASSGNPELIDVQSTDSAALYSDDDLDAVIEKYLGNPGLEQDGASKTSDVPQFESRFGVPGFGVFGGGGFGGNPGLKQNGASKPSYVPRFESRFGYPGFGGFGGGAGIGGGIGAGIGISAGIGASIGAGAGAFGYGGMGGPGFGVPGFGFPGAGFGYPGYG